MASLTSVIDVCSAMMDRAVDALDTALQKLTSANGGDQDAPPDNRVTFSRVLLAQFGLALLKSIWEPDLTGVVVIFGYLALILKNLQALDLYLVFSSVGFLVNVLRLGFYSRALAHSNAAHGVLIFLGVLGLVIQLVGLFCAQSIKPILGSASGTSGGYTSLPGLDTVSRQTFVLSTPEPGPQAPLGSAHGPTESSAYAPPQVPPPAYSSSVDIPSTTGLDIEGILEPSNPELPFLQPGAALGSSGDLPLTASLSQHQV